MSVYNGVAPIIGSAIGIGRYRCLMGIIGKLTPGFMLIYRIAHSYIGVV